MAYRVPHPKLPHNKPLARRQTFIARMAGLALLWVLVGIMAVLADRAAPVGHLPWKPLRVIDPVGLATRLKAARTGEDFSACRAALTDGGVEFTPAPEQQGESCSVHEAIYLKSGVAPLSPSSQPMTCKEALAFTIWEKQVVQPAAFELLGQGVVAIPNYGTYSCRQIIGNPDKKMSEHATANALDVAGFTLTDGTIVSVEKDWNDPGPKGQFLHKVRDGSCDVFLTTLSPDYNAEHANHLHLDMGGWPMCA
jgi:hypothetical protein